MADPVSPKESTTKRPRRVWSAELRKKFSKAFKILEDRGEATPKKIKDRMQVEGLTIDQVKSHLQKYRLTNNANLEDDEEEDRIQEPETYFSGVTNPEDEEEHWNAEPDSCFSGAFNPEDEEENWTPDSYFPGVWISRLPCQKEGEMVLRRRAES